MRAESKLALLKDLKRVLKMCVKALPPVPKTMVYPDDPQDWKVMQPDMFQKVYLSGPPMKSKVSMTDVAQAMHAWPLRKTSSHLNKPQMHRDPADSSTEEMAM